MSRLARREALRILSALPGAGPAAWSASPDLGGMVVDNLMREVEAADQRRRAELAAIRSKADLRRLQDKVRRVLHAGFGPFPERTPLEVRHTGEIAHDDYVIEKLIYQSRPGFYVTGNLYRPKSTGTRRPAVVQACGHYVEAKAKDDYQRACIGLAKRGFVVLVFDPVGQGERLMYRKPGEKRIHEEHVVSGRPMLLLGKTLANYEIWDVIRSFDYLESRPDVDARRMGLFGHSGGGMITMQAMPVEPRVRAAMSSCAVSNFQQRAKELRMVFDPEDVVPFAFGQGVDDAEMIASVAPRAFLIGIVLRDSLPVEGPRRTFEEVRQIYEMSGVPQNFAKVESDNVHQLDKNHREACYGWMLKHLAGESGPVAEPEMQIETEETLRCTKTGRVMELEAPRSLFDMNLADSRMLQRKRARPVKAGEVREMLAFPKSDPQIEIPSTLTENSAHRDLLMVLVPENGRRSEYAVTFARTLADQGCQVLSVDLRGWGETRPTNPTREKRYTWDDFLTWTYWEMGWPLIGRRVGDLLGIVQGAVGKYKKVYVVGLEAGGLVALHAAAIEPAIAGVATNRTLASYQDVLNHPIAAEPVAGYPWRALARYDLADLAQLVSPRPYAGVDPFDSQRRPGAVPMPADAAAREAFARLSQLTKV